MRAHHIVTKNVIAVSPGTSIVTAAKAMLDHHVSGLPVLGAANEVVGIVTEGDFLRRREIGTQRRRPRWLQLFLSPGRVADDFVHERGRKVEDVMTRNPITVTEDTPLEELVRLMEKAGIKRLPVLRDKTLVGIVTRANLLQAVAGLAREVPDPTADDDHIRDRIVRTIEAADWQPLGLQVTVREGVVDLHGLIADERWRRAAVVAAENTEGVKQVHDHLCLVDGWSGYYLESTEDMKVAG